MIRRQRPGDSVAEIVSNNSYRTAGKGFDGGPKFFKQRTSSTVGRACVSQNSFALMQCVTAGSFVSSAILRFCFGRFRPSARAVHEHARTTLIRRPAGVPALGPPGVNSRVKSFFLKLTEWREVSGNRYSLADRLSTGKVHFKRLISRCAEGRDTIFARMEICVLLSQKGLSRRGFTYTNPGPASMPASKCHEVGQCGDEGGRLQGAGPALGRGRHLPREQGTAELLS
jgi:hypothetical protein